MNEEWFVIKNLEDFINASRRLVFKNFGSESEDNFDIENILTNINPDDEKEMDTVLSYNESLSIVNGFIKTQKNKTDPTKTRCVLNEQRYIQIIEALNDRMVSNILHNLVNKGLIETAYDEKTNDFVFWVNEKNIGDDKTNEQ